MNLSEVNTDIKNVSEGPIRLFYQQTNISKLHRYEIILFHQAQPRPNNLDKLETPIGNPNTPLRCKYVYQTPPQYPINPHNKPTNWILTE